MIVSNYLDNIMIPHKDIHGLDVAMNDLGIVQGLEALTNLHEIFPDDLLWKGLFQLVPLLDESSQISIWGVLHHNTEQVACKDIWSTKHIVSYSGMMQQNDAFSGHTSHLCPPQPHTNTRWSSSLLESLSVIREMPLHQKA